MFSTHYWLRRAPLDSASRVAARSCGMDHPRARRPHIATVRLEVARHPNSARLFTIATVFFTRRFWALRFNDSERPVALAYYRKVEPRDVGVSGPKESRGRQHRWRGGKRRHAEVSGRLKSGQGCWIVPDATRRQRWQRIETGGQRPHDNLWFSEDGAPARGSSPRFSVTRGVMPEAAQRPAPYRRSDAVPDRCGDRAGACGPARTASESSPDNRWG